MASEVWFDAIGRIARGIVGIAPGAVHAAGTTDQGVRPLPEELTDLPAVVLGYGGASVIAGTWESQTHTVSGEIWVSRDPLGERYAQLIGFIDALLDAFPSRSKAFNADARVQSVLITSIEPIAAREWPVNQNRWYLVLPWSMEVKVRQARDYKPE